MSVPRKPGPLPCQSNPVRRALGPAPARWSIIGSIFERPNGESNGLLTGVSVSRKGTIWLQRLLGRPGNWGLQRDIVLPAGDEPRPAGPAKDALLTRNRESQTLLPAGRSG
jgi:hypothetical protein